MTPDTSTKAVEEVIGRLREPVDWAHFTTNDHTEEYAAGFARLADLLASLVRERDEARAALKPFAELGAIMLPSSPGDDSPWVKAPDSTSVKDVSAYGLTFGNFRAAIRSLLPQSGGDDIKHD